LITNRAINKDYLPEAEIWAIAAQLLDALDNMHNRAATYKSLFNLLHRDIKPANSAYQRRITKQRDQSLTLALYRSISHQGHGSPSRRLWLSRKDR
jgi:serine/threonine protein kinase